MIRRSLVRALGVSCCTLALLAACRKGASLDRADLQAKVGAEAARLTGVKVASTTCPAAVTPAAGATFTCDVAFVGGGALTLTVTQTDAAGSLTVRPVGDWLLGDAMEADLVTELFLLGHHDATVDCGGAVVPVQLPRQVRCTVKDGATTTGVDVAVDAQRGVTWKLVGTP